MRFPTKWYVQRLRPACANEQSDQSLCLSLEYSMNINPLMPNVFSHHYKLDESISNFRVVG